MAEYTYDTHPARLVLKDRPNVRERLLYKGTLGMTRGTDYYVKMWEAAQPIITEFECEFVKVDDDLDVIDDPRAAEVIQWVGLMAMTHMAQIEVIPKN